MSETVCKAPKNSDAPVSCSIRATRSSWEIVGTSSANTLTLLAMALIQCAGASPSVSVRRPCFAGWGGMPLCLCLGFMHCLGVVDSTSTALFLRAGVPLSLSWLHSFRPLSRAGRIIFGRPVLWRHGVSAKQSEGWGTHVSENLWGRGFSVIVLASSFSSWESLPSQPLYGKPCLPCISYKNGSRGPYHSSLSLSRCQTGERSKESRDRHQRSAQCAANH